MFLAKTKTKKYKIKTEKEEIKFEDLYKEMNTDKWFEAEGKNIPHLMI